MPAGQFVSRQIVVKVVFIKAYHIKIPPVVLTMAGGAIFPLYFPGYVKSFIPVNPCFDFLVAAQALVVGHFTSQIVALGAIRHAFQLLVCIGQITRRQLSRDPGGKQAKEKYGIKDPHDMVCKYN